ncbi:MAG: TetR/AcrR family transcriptional regulator [Methylobacteriaceae bacterium]|nr:TetR/AcrR family transcriptional regulator [Rhodoblastus sp.]MCC0005823.1 TetR/AcrR family transcriptional regulator [Methylobacteriaceae bacterium]
MAYRKTEFVENKQKATRERIVRTARALVELGGWKNCSLNAVAAEAGVSVGSVYTHFGKITDLYIDVFEAIAGEEVAILAKIVASSGSASERFLRAVDTFARRALRGRIKAYAVIAEPVAAEVDNVRQKAHAWFIDEFEKIIACGVETGEFRPQNPRISAACVLGLLAETLVIPLSPDAAPLADSGAQLRAEILDFCRRAVGVSSIA